MSNGGGGLPPLPKSLSGLLSFSRESFSRAEATLGGILGSTSATHPSTPAGNSRGGSSSSSSGYISSSSTASPAVVAKENVAPILTTQQQQPQQQQQQQQPSTGFQQYSSVKVDCRPSPSPSPFRPIQSPGPRAFQVCTNNVFAFIPTLYLC